MRKRNQSGNDSLEMFLDTICNTFGGILFILLFIVLQLQVTQKSVSEAIDNPVAAAEFEKLQAEWEEKRDELEKLLGQIDLFKDLTENLSDKEARANYEKLQELLTTNQQLLAKIASVSAQVSKNDADTSGHAEVNQSLLQEKKKLEAEVAQIEADMPEVDETQEPIKLTCPQLRTVDKREIGLILMFNRLYLWHNYTEDGDRNGLNAEDFTILRYSDGRARVLPNPWRGIDVTAQGADKKIGALVRPFSPDSSMIALITAIDSFDQYHIVRDALKKRGYDIEPLYIDLNGSRIADRGGTGDREAQ